MKPEYENLLRNMQIESVTQIRETDTDPDKWYELFIDEGDAIGTHTVESGDTFSEIAAKFEEYADKYGVNSIHIDVWSNRESPCQLSGIPYPAATSKLYNVYFRIETGYVWGEGLSKERTDAFIAEIGQLFTAAGYGLSTKKYTDCPDVSKGKTNLYCHPMEISGCCEENHIEEIETILSNAKTFTYIRTDNYGQLFDYTPEQEIEYYRQHHGDYMEDKLFTYCMTRRGNLYHNKREILELASNNIHIKTTRCPSGSIGGDPCSRFMCEVYDSMIAKGHLVECIKLRGDSQITLCRSATRKEMKLLKKQNITANNKEKAHANNSN